MTSIHSNPTGRSSHRTERQESANDSRSAETTREIEAFNADQSAKLDAANAIDDASLSINASVLAKAASGNISSVI